MSGPTRLSLFYFLYYAGTGTSMAYLAPYLRGLGLSGTAIGSVLLIGPLLSAPAGLAWAVAADRFGAATPALRVASLGVLLPLTALPFTHRPGALAALFALQGLSAGAVVPLIDGIAVEYLGALGMSYPRTRLFGSLGYVALAQGMGVWLTARGELPADTVVPWTMVSCTAAYALVAQGLPRLPTTRPRPRRADLSALLADRRIWWLLGICALHWLCCAPYNLFFGVFVRDHGLPSRVTGMGMAVGVVAEVAVLWSADRLPRSVGIPGLLALSFGGTALRWLALARASGVVAVVGLQALHGLTFGLFWATVVRALSELVPSHLRVTGQALFSAVVFGAANALGYQLAGWGLDHLGGAASLFDLAAVGELIPLGILTLGRRPSP